MFSLNSVTKIFVSKRARICHLLFKRPGCYHSDSKTNVKDTIFKLNPIHASAFFQIPDLLNSLNAIKVLLHLGKTVLFFTSKLNKIK